MSEDTCRVTMIWPQDLHAQVRARVHSRGLTAWVLDAVRARLNETPDADMRELVQRMANSIALGGDYEDREMAIHMLDLPDWVDRSEWPWVKGARQLVSSESGSDAWPDSTHDADEVDKEADGGESPAPDLDAPEPEPELEPDPQPDVETQPATERAEEPQEPEMALSSCPTCNMPLIDGECWTCG